jgi:tRNA U34 5-carboxymethylaminomethyl modifying GTPase MnmE/TrmE
MFFIRNKIDNLGQHSGVDGTGIGVGESISSNVQQFNVSCVTGDGISLFESALTQAALSLLSPQSSDGDVSDATESAVITRDRHRSHVKRCVRHLDEFIDAGLPMDAAAEELRYTYVHCIAFTTIYITLSACDLLLLYYYACFLKI